VQSNCSRIGVAELQAQGLFSAPTFAPRTHASALLPHSRGRARPFTKFDMSEIGFIECCIKIKAARTVKSIKSARQKLHHF